MIVSESGQGSLFTESGRLRVSSGNLVPTTSFTEAVDFINGVVNSGEGLYVLTGAPGAGKTAVLNYCRDLAADHAVVLLEQLRRIDTDSLAALLNEAFNVEMSHEQGPRSQALRYFLKLGTLRAKGQRFVLVLDDVEEIHSSGAELIRALLDMKVKHSPLITLILSGNQRLDALLDRSYRWGIQKLIRDNHKITPLNVSQAGNLIDQIPALRGASPIRFSPGAKKTLVTLSGGHPGSLIQLGHRAANIGRRFGAKSVSPRMARGAATGRYRSPATVASSATWKAGLALLILLLIPVAVMQQDMNNNDYSRQPVGGVVDPDQSAATSAPVAPPPVDRRQPDIAALEDSIDISATAEPTAAKTTSPDATQPDLNPTDVAVATDEIVTAVNAGPPDTQESARDIPGFEGKAFLGFNQQIPPSPAP